MVGPSTSLGIESLQSEQLYSIPDLILPFDNVIQSTLYYTGICTLLFHLYSSTFLQPPYNSFFLVIVNH